MDRDPAALSVEELRRRRDEVHEAQDVVSYRRRLLHAQLDIVAAAVTATGPNALATTLDRVLADAPSTGPARAVAVRAHASEVDLPPLPEDLLSLSDGARRTLVARLRDDERATSRRRRELLDELDTLQDELVRRYQRDGFDARAVMGVESGSSTVGQAAHPHTGDA